MKLLLLNYSKNDAETIAKATGAEVFRGYISDGGKLSMGISGKKEPYYNFYTPIPPYECSMVFVNLDNFEASESEFEDKEKTWEKRDTVNFRQYWMRGDNLAVFFVGDTKVGEMYHFGAPLKLIGSSGVDRETVVSLREDRIHRPLFDELNKQLSVPPSHYIEAMGDDDFLYKLNTKAFFCIRNRNDDALSIALSKNNGDYSAEEIGLIVLPATKNLAYSTVNIFQHFDQSSPDWVDSDDFYPSSTLNTLKEEIEEIDKKASDEVSKRRTQIEEHKKKYLYLKDLVTSQGDILVDAVYKVLTDLLGLNVIKSDELNPSSPKEDLLVHYENKQILIEVKGTKRPYPSLKYPQQAVQHALRQGLKDVTSTGLILNHDFETIPTKRKLAYNDKDTASLITDIHFIDTRLLLEVAKQIIDGQLKAKTAADILFAKEGRAQLPKPGKEKE